MCEEREIKEASPVRGEEKTRVERRQHAKETRDVGRQPGVMEKRDEKCRKKAPCVRVV
jgi:hypothetical protein